MMHLRSDPLVDEIQRLAPEVTVNGGSFAHWLPHPMEVSSARRSGLLENVRQDATGKCLTDLVARAGLPAAEPGRLASGEREWPTGYVGSVSHKGTKVVAALAPVDQVRSLGIDIETQNGAGDLARIGGLTAVNELPTGLAAMGPVILFSVKEAAFKALYPLFSRPLDFEDVMISWADSPYSTLRGTARHAGVALDVRCSVTVPSWVASIALLPS